MDAALGARRLGDGERLRAGERFFAGASAAAAGIDAREAEAEAGLEDCDLGRAGAGADTGAYGSSISSS